MKWPLSFLLSCSLLCACIGPREVAQTQYTLTMENRAQPTPTPPDRQTNITLQVADITAPQWLNSSHIFYQLLYRDTETIAYYSRAQWVSPPPLLIIRMLQDTLSNGPWTAVIGPENSEHADMALHVNLTEFQQNFTAAKESHAVLHATVTLSDNHSNRVVAQQQMDFQVPASQADASGGVEALNRAANELVSAINQWVPNAVSGNSEGPIGENALSRYKKN